jgi:GT2 family glycosyltransferase
MESVAVSIVSFNGRKHVGPCLEAVLAQTSPPLEVFLLDNASSDGTAGFVEENFPTVKVIRSEANLGFGAGHNLVIRKTKASYFVALNQDAYLSPGFLETLVTAVEKYPEVGIAGGKLYSLRDGVANGPSEKIIDMTWLDIEKKRRQVCYSHCLQDNEKDLTPRFVFAIDGAVMLLRRTMLEEIEVDGEYYDEDFFAGKEDLDISWRAQLCGWKCLYVPSAVGHHFRTFTPQDRRSEISGVLRAGSIRNRYLLMLKNDLFMHFLRHFPHIALYDLKILAYLLFYERSSLKGYAQAFQLAPKALRKRRVIMRRKAVDDAYILHWFK